MGFCDAVWVHAWSDGVRCVVVGVCQALMSIKSLMVLSTDRARQKALIVSLLAVVLIVLPFVWSSFADDDFCESE